MKKLRQAKVKWHRFGETHKDLLGERFEDGGERLAIVTCPLCGGNRSLEYNEYMQLLRVDELRCNACHGIYTLRPLASLKSGRKSNADEEKEVLDRPTEPELKRPTGKPGRDGKRDWGKA
jgi:hypothetical protein